MSKKFHKNGTGFIELSDKDFEIFLEKLERFNQLTEQV